MSSEKIPGAPDFNPVTFGTLRRALGLGIKDMRAAKGYGFVFTLPYVLGGLLFAYITWASGQTYWLIFAAFGFPLIGPFASVGLYEVSRRLEKGLPLTKGDIFGVVNSQRSGQLPWLSVVIIMIVLFWFFLGHVIFALFLGLSAMTNVSSSFAVFLTNEGITMLVFGSAVGAGFSLLVFAISVFGIPMLLDREVDFVTAMIASFQAVLKSPIVLIVWAMGIVVFLTIGMLPVFIGLFLTMPLLAHASWHLYDQSIVKDQ